MTNIAFEPGKIATISVLSREVVMRSGAQSAVETIMREDAGASLDAAYLSTAAAGSVPAGLLNGVTPITPDVDEGTAAMLNDMANAGAAAATGGSGDVVFIVSPDRAAKIKIRAPLLADHVLASIAVATDRMIAVDPFALVHAFGSLPDIDASEHATLHMDSVPAQISDGGVAAPVRSMWQTDSIAIRMILDISFGKRSANAAAYVDGIENW